MFWRRRKRLEEEIQSHLAEETADNVARGMNPGAAQRAALRTFGNIGSTRERARELDPLYWLDTLWQDTRFAFRQIARNGWTSVTIVASLTVGIALNVGVFSVLNGLLLRPWVHSEPETFVSLIPSFSGEYGLMFSDGGMSQPDYVWYRDSAKSLDFLAAYRLLAVTLSGAEAGSIRAGLISCNLFDVMRPGPPVLGRYLIPNECATPLQAPVAILSETAWRARFNADKDVVGRIVHLNRIPFTVIGVAPGFPLPGMINERDVWVPYTMLGSLRPADGYFADPRAHWLNVIGRRRLDHSLEQVRQEMNTLAHYADRTVPGRVTSLLVTDGSVVQEPERRARASLLLGVTLGAATLLLLLACVNVTTLLLSRSAARQHEISVRLSLGAGRLRLLRQLLTESFVLSGVAAAVSLLIAQFAPAALWRSVIAEPSPFDLSPDWRVLLYCLAAAITVAVVVGLSPAIESLRPRLSESLKGSGKTATQGRRGSRLRGVLVGVQIALSLLLLVEAGLFARTQRRFFSHDPGFETKQVINVTLASVLEGFEPPMSFYQELEARVSALPEVVQTSFASPAPWNGRNSGALLEIDGKPLPETRDFRRDPARRAITPEYFSVLGIEVVRGRAFRRTEMLSERQVSPTVISEAMARRYWPDKDPVGRHFKTFRTHHEVIGVVRDVQSVNYMQDDGPFYYYPIDTQQSKPAHMLVRVSGNAEALAAVIRDILRQLDPQLAAGAFTLASVIEGQGERLEPVLFYGSVGAGLALLLALTGVYAVVSFSVSQRVREIGIRVALGARPGEVVSLVLRSGALPAGIGLVAGIALALAVSAGIESMLFGMNPHDPFTFTVAPLILSVAVLGAMWLPARRAARLDPLRSLRQE